MRFLYKLIKAAHVYWDTLNGYRIALNIVRFYHTTFHFNGAQIIDLIYFNDFKVLNFSVFE